MNWKHTVGIASFATILSIIVSLITISQTMPTAISGIFNKNLPVGTIVASMIEYDKFKDIVDGKWVPADGGNVSRDSKYYEMTKQPILPDLRGMFIRGLNAFESNNPQIDDKKDPDDERYAGHYQTDAFQKHKHESSTRIDASGGHIFGWGGGKPGKEQETKLSSIMNGYITDGNRKPSVDDETRPKNVAVYYYIKID